MEKVKEKKKTNNKKKRIEIVVLICLLFILAAIIFFRYKKCPFDYTYRNSICSKTVVFSPVEKYKCSDDYILENGMCRKEIEINNTETYSCPKMESTNQIQVSDISLYGNKCKYTLTYDAVEKKVCPSGCFLSKADECTCMLELPTGTIGSGQFERPFCPIGDLIGDKCVSITYPKPTTKQECIKGDLFNGKKCVSYVTDNAILEQKCPDGYNLINGKCKSELSKPATIEYECPTGSVLYNGSCERTYYYK